MENLTRIPEQFFYNGEFVNDVEYFIEQRLEDYSVENADSLPDDFQFEIELCDYEKMFELDANELTNILSDVHEDRSSEDGDEWEGIRDKIKECVDFEKLNAAIPSLYYCNGKTHVITKKDILNY